MYLWICARFEAVFHFISARKYGAPKDQQTEGNQNGGLFERGEERGAEASAKHLLWEVRSGERSGALASRCMVIGLSSPPRLVDMAGGAPPPSAGGGAAGAGAGGAGAKVNWWKTVTEASKKGLAEGQAKLKELKLQPNVNVEVDFIKPFTSSVKETWHELHGMIPPPVKKAAPFVLSAAGGCIVTHAIMKAANVRAQRDIFLRDYSHGTMRSAQDAPAWCSGKELTGTHTHAHLLRLASPCARHGGAHENDRNAHKDGTRRSSTLCPRGSTSSRTKYAPRRRNSFWRRAAGAARSSRS